MIFRWTDEATDLLRKYHAEGLTFADIAYEMNRVLRHGTVTRNGCIGKAQRMGLVRRGLDQRIAERVATVKKIRARPPEALAKHRCKSDLSFEKASELFAYDPETGVITWRPRTGKIKKNWNTRYAGTPAGGNSDGYICIMLKRSPYKAHRLAWLLHYGQWPSLEIDHINGDRADNRIRNLREVTWAENHQNTKVLSSNTSGYPNVHWYARKQKWQVQIVAEGSRHNIGYFDDFGDACRAADEAKLRLHISAPRHPAFSNAIEDGIGFMDQAQGLCKWPLTVETDFENFRVCGCLCKLTQPYCDEHTAKAYQARQPRPPRDAERERSIKRNMSEMFFKDWV